ncbi:uncharacterized protein LOC127712594 [Mytilus californianus]|uniref:uncharacterized protein LOC127712594 n=1 Tax=Mytilus californianus TaxID=6549 RepID=UPI00224625E8|nr:uncharacterized protein LOC127712594 [Mytilus californianus]
MSTMHRQLPHITNLIDEVDTIIIDRTILEDGSIKSSGLYTIKNEIVDDRNIARITPNDKDHIHNRNLTITDDNGKMVLMCVNDNRNCLRNALHIYSPAGFLLGTVRERHFKWKADYDICTGNQEVIFLVTHDSSASYLIIKIKQKIGKDMVAALSSSHGENGEVIYSIISKYFESI